MPSVIAVAPDLLCFLLLIVECKTHVFFCDFESNSLCGIQNGSPVNPIPPAINFTIRTPQTVTYPDLGPSSGRSFLYWSRSDDPPEGELINGQVHTGRFNQSENMCVRFSYYIQSNSIDNNTWLDVSTGGCYGTSLYFIHQDRTDGWQVITVPLHNYSCAISLYITVNQRQPARMALAFDYIIVDPCHNYASRQTWNIFYFLLVCFFNVILR